APGTYVVMMSGTNAFAVQDSLGHKLLGGAANFVPTFTVGSSTTPIINAPYFARGYGQGVHVLPANTASVLSATDDASRNVTVTTGVYVGNPAAISTLSESGTTVTVTTSAPHGFTNGQLVMISGASVAGYSGIFTIGNVTGTTFTYTAGAPGLASATG